MPLPQLIVSFPPPPRTQSLPLPPLIELAAELPSSRFAAARARHPRDDGRQGDPGTLDRLESVCPGLHLVAGHAGSRPRWSPHRECSLHRHSAGGNSKTDSSGGNPSPDHPADPGLLSPALRDRAPDPSSPTTSTRTAARAAITHGMWSHAIARPADGTWNHSLPTTSERGGSIRIEERIVVSFEDKAVTVDRRDPVENDPAEQPLLRYATTSPTPQVRRRPERDQGPIRGTPRSMLVPSTTTNEVEPPS